MYKVFYNDRLVLLAEKIENIPDHFQEKQLQSKQELFTFLDDYFRLQPNYDVGVYGYELSSMFNDFKSYFKFVMAAGGLVKNEDNFLFIKRWGLWDLPKGKVEKKETIERAAVREVEEETNVGELLIHKRIDDTYHIYQSGECWYLKQTAWFFMLARDRHVPRPQVNEGITDVVWLAREQSILALSESYRSLKETLMSYL